MDDNGPLDEVGNNRRPRAIFYSNGDHSRCTRTLRITAAD
jgi:hypothetical protein